MRILRKSLIRYLNYQLGILHPCKPHLFRVFYTMVFSALFARNFFKSTNFLLKIRTRLGWHASYFLGDVASDTEGLIFTLFFKQNNLSSCKLRSSSSKPYYLIFMENKVIRFSSYLSHFQPLRLFC